MNREAWLEAAVEQLRPTLTFEGAPRVSVGFPSKGALRGTRSSTTIGQCWPGEVAADERVQVYVSPLLDEPVQVLAVLLHELIHFKVGCEAKHGKLFKRQMRQVGLEGKATATVPGAQLTAVLERKAVELGAYPHAALDPKQLRLNKQTTRLLKASCPACEATVRITAKWVAEGEESRLPYCGWCATEGEDGGFVGERMVLVGGKDKEEG